MTKGSQKANFLTDLADESLEFVSSKWILERTPFIFIEDHHSYLKWKIKLSEKICVDSTAIIITGSASTGFSLNPNKNFRDYNEDSDVDVAIISNYYFNYAWYILRNLGTKRYTLNPKQKASLQDHVGRLIYWGTIATDRILPLLPFGNEWQKSLDDMSNINPTQDRDINIRIYKDAESLKAYCINNLNQLRQFELESSVN